MPSTSNENPDKQKLTSKPIHFLSSAIKYIVSFPPHYLVIRLFGAVILLLLVVSTGSVFAEDGIFLMLGVLVYILLIYFTKRTEK